MRKLALGLLAAASVTLTAPAHAQGLWFGGPGFGIGIGTGYSPGPYYSEVYWGPGWSGAGYYRYAPAYSRYDDDAYAPGYAYRPASYVYDEPSFTYAEPGYAVAYEPAYERRYIYADSLRSPRYSRAYVPRYASARNYAYRPAYRTRHVYADGSRSPVRSANVIQSRSATVGSAVRTDAQPSLRFRTRRGQD